MATVRQAPSNATSAAPVIINSEPTKRGGLRLGSAILAILAVLAVAFFVTVAAYKGKKTKAKQRKNDQKFVLKENNQNSKLSDKSSKRTQKQDKSTTKRTKGSSKGQPKGGGKTTKNANPTLSKAAPAGK